MADRRHALFEMKYDVRLRTLCRGVAVTLTICLTLAGSSGCARSMLTGLFVNHDNRGEVDMFRLVESPPGHLNGSFVVSSLNADGSRKKDAVYDVTGTITGSNVSLQLEGGLVGLAEFFGASTNLVGSLRGRTLTLSAGNQTEVFREISQKQYGDVLASLDETGQHIAMVENAKNAAQEVESNDRQLNADLKSYIAWGQQRIGHVSNGDLRRWYADRIDRYTKCLQSIRPLAAQGIPSWRWQDCVLTVQNDEYYRDQEAQSIRDLQRQNHDTIARLEARISPAQQQFPKVLDEVKSACPYAKDVDACEKELQKLNLLSPDGFLDSKLITTYRSIAPQVSTAISADMQIATTGQSSLSSIAQQVEKVYRLAR
jgi:hypothetical protein